MKNEMEIWFTARAENESLARMAVTAFMLEADPTMEQIADVKTAVSEAVTNSIIHGYGREEEPKEDEDFKIRMKCKLKDKELYLEVEDMGCGIEDIPKAMEPLYTTRPDMERSGMGFSFMEAFMDHIEVESQVGSGTLVKMLKNLQNNEDNSDLDKDNNGNNGE